jgi:hypothetical protein
MARRWHDDRVAIWQSMMKWHRSRGKSGPRSGATAQEAGARFLSAALVDIRGSAYRRQLLTLAVPAADGGDYVDHILAVAAATVDLPGLIVDPSSRFNGYTLAEWLAVLASGDDARAAWVREVLAEAGYTMSSQSQQRAAGMGGNGTAVAR